MSVLHAIETERLDVSADRVYRCIADFKNHHPNFLPHAFSDFQVEEGGYGEGTVHSFTVSIGGRQRRMRMRVNEPEPGRVITESATDWPMVTTFTVTPDGNSCVVRIETQWGSARGLTGLLERLFAPRLMRKMYREELRLLEEYAQGTSQGGG